MREKVKKQVFVMPWILCLMLFLIPTAALPWDAATHAYIEEHLYKKQGQTDDTILYNRTYGANALDLFNNKFSSPYLEFTAYLHDTTRDNILKTWEKAAGKTEKAFAYGFVGHNNTWGMDSTAHVSGITCGRGEGYVKAKARLLAVMIGPALESQLGSPLPYEVLVALCHYLVESGVDFLVRDLDPSIGNKVSAAALNRGSEVPTLLVNTYASDFSGYAGSRENAEQIIRTTEGNFRASMIGYGFALSQEKDKALDLVAGGLAETGVSYLGLPAGSEAALVPVARQGIVAAMMLCAPDFEDELKATTGWLNGRLSSKGVVWQ